MKNPEQPSSDLADRLPFCPRCTYPFTGLPEAHQCPECGLAYDAESRMWITHRRISNERITQLASGCFNLIIGLIFLVGFSGRTVIAPVGLAIIAVGILSLAVGWRATLKRPHYLALLPDGIWYHTRSRHPRSLPWTQIRFADDDWRLLGPALRIHLNPRGRVDVPRNLIYTTADAVSVVEMVVARVSHQRN